MKKLRQFLPTLVGLAVLLPLVLVMWRGGGGGATTRRTPVEDPRPQVTPVASPDGRTVARVDILEEPCPEGFEACWVVSFHSPLGQELFRETEGFPARWNVYWTWDEQGRFWLHNSDDGATYRWTPSGHHWGRELMPFLPYEQCIGTATPDPRCPPARLAPAVYRQLVPR
jgi:hypothetical protein